MPDRSYWLVKSEPDSFSYHDLERAPEQTTCWNGVRNYQARNTMRDGMRRGDLVLFYHSNAEPPGVAGICRVVREAYPDHTAFDPNDEYHDPKSDASNPTWLMVDVQAVAPAKRFVSLDDLRAMPELEGLELLRRGSRLSVIPVSAPHFEAICTAARIPKSALR